VETFSQQSYLPISSIHGLAEFRAAKEGTAQGNIGSNGGDALPFMHVPINGIWICDMSVVMILQQRPTLKSTF
jgi:hypothetical protein